RGSSKVARARSRSQLISRCGRTRWRSRPMSPSRFLVTGGSQGIGAAIVELARTAGHQVVFTGRNQQLIDATARTTGAHGLRADVSKTDDNARTVDICREQMGGIDVLVNNAAYAYRGQIGALDVSKLR